MQVLNPNKWMEMKEDAVTEIDEVLSVDRLSAQIGERMVLNQITFALKPGELLAVVGPSGSGKSSLLNLIAGFLKPSDGEIRLDGERISASGYVMPPERRKMGMVFQSHALWPQMTVIENVAFPQLRQGSSKKEALQAANEALQAVGMAEFEHRYPEHLSGGQQQRVGLARALAANPRIFLFDEPTANLDPINRLKFADEVRWRQQAAGIAAIYVTHHLQEAFEIADRVMVLMNGTVQQIGAPATIYESPASPYVASLGGKFTSFQAKVLQTETDHLYEVLLAEKRFTLKIHSAIPLVTNQIVQLMCRPEWGKVHIGLNGIIRNVRYQGAATLYELETSIGLTYVSEVGRPRHVVGQSIGWTPLEAAVIEPLTDSN